MERCIVKVSFVWWGYRWEDQLLTWWEYWSTDFLSIGWISLRRWVLWSNAISTQWFFCHLSVFHGGDGINNNIHMLGSGHFPSFLESDNICCVRPIKSGTTTILSFYLAGEGIGEKINYFPDESIDQMQLVLNYFFVTWVDFMEEMK